MNRTSRLLDANPATGRASAPADRNTSLAASTTTLNPRLCNASEILMLPSVRMTNGPFIHTYATILSSQGRAPKGNPRIAKKSFSIRSNSPGASAHSLSVESM